MLQRTYGEALHGHLSKLDREGTAYRVKLLDGKRYAVASHGPGHLEVRLDDKAWRHDDRHAFLNLALIPSVEIEEL